MHDAAEVEEPSEEKSMASAEWSPGPTNVNLTPANGHVAKRKRTGTPGKTMMCRYIH